MYTKFYGLSIDPFRLSPDSHFCLLHSSFTRAKAYMQYALHRGEGFAVVSGRPGTGKTTLIDSLLSDFNSSELDLARLVNARLEGSDLLRMVCYAFGIEADGAGKSDLLQRLSKHMGRSLQRKKRPLLIVDEAQGLTIQALEELRLLTNLQLDGRPLLQIFLVGQEELQELLADPRMEQVRQRVIGACRLQPLKPRETIAYVQHRLKVAGWDGVPKLRREIFPPLFRFSDGIPRLINQACSRLLLHGTLEQREELDEQAINLVVDELRAEGISIPVTSRFIDLEDFDDEVMQEAAPPVPSGQPGTETTEELLNALVSLPFEDPGAGAGLQERVDPLIPPPPEHSLVESPQSIIPVSWQPEPVALIEAPAKGTEFDKTPWWGLAASLVLAFSVFTGSLLLIPRHELDERVPDSFWGYQGIVQIRDLVSHWTGGNWPLRGSDGGGESLTMPDSEFQPPIEKIAGAVSYPVTLPDAEQSDWSELDEKQTPETSIAPIVDAAGQLPSDKLVPVSDPPLDKEVRTPVSQIFFGFDSVKILPKHQKRLDAVVRMLIASTEYTAHIIGYTDETGPSVYNDFLSKQRAEAVAAYIKARGVPDAQLKVEGRAGARTFGEDPGESNTGRAVKIYFEPGNAFTHRISYDPSIRQSNGKSGEPSAPRHTADMISLKGSLILSRGVSPGL